MYPGCTSHCSVRGDGHPDSAILQYYRTLDYRMLDAGDSPGICMNSICFLLCVQGYTHEVRVDY